jgi:membrane protein YqaA with SNARE-associated domain
MSAVSGDPVIWVTVLLIAAGLNAVPAFMPPTWSVLAYFHFREGLPIVALAAIGALGATTGRALLALASRAIGARVLPRRWRANIETLAAELRRRRELGLAALALFALGPVPSNQLFVAAGIARAPLAPILAVFAVARFVSYVVWITVADTAAVSLADVVTPRFGAEVATIVQIAGFLLLIVVMQLDWSRILRRDGANANGSS